MVIVGSNAYGWIEVEKGIHSRVCRVVSNYTATQIASEAYIG